MTTSRILAAAALTLTCAAAAPALAQDTQPKITELKLQIVSGSVENGKPTAYVTFRSSEKLSDTFLYRTSTRGLEGRIMTGKGTRCYRSAVRFKDRNGEPPGTRLKLGSTYAVAVVAIPERGSDERSSLANRKVTARTFKRTSAKKAPSC